MLNPPSFSPLLPENKPLFPRSLPENKPLFPGCLVENKLLFHGRLPDNKLLLKNKPGGNNSNLHLLKTCLSKTPQFSKRPTVLPSRESVVSIGLINNGSW
jgi:hypothetical protein